ncbi:BNR repeat-containing protein [Sunxiuqinia indica]|uniref:BNR repeat-containing protein n=1 Tax=Sunxiuqinia indica TaxID=2692584 RepID=UPI001357C851|nr:BNR repeat-containing protein [Sunxiuqinia indica]
MNKNILSLLVATFILVSCSKTTEKQEKQQTTPYVVAEEGAWCWFADPRAIHYENEAGTINKTFIGYIDIHGNIKATQHDFISKQTQEVLIRSWFQPDDHNNPTFLILPDERVMVFYSRHTDEPCFYYRVSNNPGDITDLGPELKIETKYNTTYPSPFILSDDPEHFYLCWRGISWHPTIAKLSIPDQEGQVELVDGPTQIVQSTASRPYAKYVSNGKDKIYMAYTTGHPDPTMPNYLYLNYIDIDKMELKDINGKVLAKIGDELHQVAATEAYQQKYGQAVVDQTQLRDWLWQVVLDENEHPGVAMVQISEDKSSHDYYYAKWTGSEWRKTFLSNGGGHFHQSPDIEKCYSGGMAIDDQNPNEIYCSVPVDGKHGEVYELIKYTIDESGAISHTDTLTNDSELNNVRPFIVSNRADSPLKLTWMNGNYYDWIVSKKRPLGFCTSIFADYNLTQDVALNKGLVSDDSLTNQTVKLPDSKEFSVFLNISLDTANYSGALLTSNKFEYGLSTETAKPYLRYDEQVASSNNILGNSDRWKTANRSTGGVWYNPVKYTSIRLTLVFANGTLITYINGLIDQVMELDEWSVKQVNLEKLILKTNDYKVYNRKLNYTEIKKLSEK